MTILELIRYIHNLIKLAPDNFVDKKFKSIEVIEGNTFRINWE